MQWKWLLNQQWPCNVESRVEESKSSSEREKEWDEDESSKGEIVGGQGMGRGWE